MSDIVERLRVHQSPLERQRAKFDALVHGSAKQVAEVLRDHPQYKWTRDFVENLRAAHHKEGGR